MASSYPGGLDNFATNRTDSTAMATTHKDDHNNANDALNKIEAELGINPSAAFSSVLARLDSMQSAIDLLTAGGGLQHASVQYVSTTGSDGANGQSWATAKRTVQSAYSALPAPGAGADKGGGFVLIAPGAYDVGSGVTMAENKPARFAAAVGGRHHRHGEGGQTDYNVRIYSSSTPTALFSYVTSGTLMQGSEWDGLYFDISSSTTIASAIYAEGLNHAVITNCCAEGVSPNSTPQYMLRSKEGSAGDNSWWRFERNNTRYAGLAYMGTSTDTNCNQNVFIGNVIMIGSGIGIRIQGSSGGPHRNSTFANNIETTSGPGPGILLEGCYGTTCIGDAGEGVDTFIKSVAGGGNQFMPIGISPNSTKVLVDDQSNNGDLILTSAMTGAGYGTGTTSLDRAIAFSGNGSGNTITPTYDAPWPKPTAPTDTTSIINLLKALRLSA